ncbi:MAG: PQQ-dependent sugar dehydrogenase [Actinomycetota bacterium]|nr:PQQ-dependent sugar dehydrogenase [Actinomycetota bacterium]
MSEEVAASAAVDVVAAGFEFPTSLTFDDQGTAYVAEAGLPFAGAVPGGRVWRLRPDGERDLLVEGLRPPVNGLTFHAGALFVSEGGHPARISRLDLADSSLQGVVEGLPGPGNYHTNMTVIGPDGRLYFSQGALTNTGIVGLDAYEVGWLGRLPHAHDIPGFDLVLTGENAVTPDPVSDGGEAVTGAFVPFGTSTAAGQTIPTGLPATAAVMRCDVDGANLELVAWGLRNAYGLGFLRDGRLLVTDQGPDDRGSRPVGNAPDLLFEVQPGAWYGWPDFVGGEPVTDPRYRPERGPPLRSLIANHDQLPAPQRPLVRFPPHSAAVKFDVIPRGAHAGDLLVALFGDEAPMTGPPGPTVGRSVARVDSRTWTVHPFLSGLDRPIDVRFDPHASSVFIVDFGRFEMTTDGVDATPGSGRVLRKRWVG